MIALILSVCLGVALSAACGFRVFIPLLAASVGAHFGWLPLGDGMAWLGSWSATVCLGVAAVVEVAAYYVPFVDNFLDTLTTPLSVVAGTLLSAGVLSDAAPDPLLHWGLGAVLGGGSAGIMQAGTTLIRAKLSAFTGGVANGAFATTENSLAVALSIFAIILPAITALCIMILFYFIVKKIFVKKKSPQKTSYI